MTKHEPTVAMLTGISIQPIEIIVPCPKLQTEASNSSLCSVISPLFHVQCWAKVNVVFFKALRSTCYVWSISLQFQEFNQPFICTLGLNLGFLIGWWIAKPRNAGCTEATQRPPVTVGGAWRKVTYFGQQKTGSLQKFKNNPGIQTSLVPWSSLIQFYSSFSESRLWPPGSASAALASRTVSWS